MTNEVTKINQNNYNALVQASGYEATPTVSGMFSGLADTIGDAATYGVAATAASVATSFYNTGVSLANTFGAEIDKYEVDDLLEDLSMYESAEYYDRNSTVVDTLGLIVGSTVPGMGAIRGLRTVQTALRGRDASKLTPIASGIKKALVPEDMAKQALRKIRQEGNLDQISDFRKRLLWSNMHQEALETLAYELATIGTMNQNPILNQDDLDYIDSFIQNSTSGWTWAGVGLGGALGGAMRYLSTKGDIYRMADATERYRDSITHLDTLGVATKVDDSLTMEHNLATGDELVPAWHQYRAIVQARNNAKNPAAYDKRVKSQKSIINKAINKLLVNTNDDIARAARSMFEEMLEEFTETGNFQVFEEFSGLANIQGFSKQFALEQTPSKHILLMSPEDAAAERFEWFKGLRDGKGKSPYDGKTDNELRKLAAEGVLNMTNVINRGASFGGGTGKGYFSTYKTTNPHNNLAYVIVRDIDTLRQMGDSDNIDDFLKALEFTYRHELGHLHETELQRIFTNTTLGKKLYAEAEAISRIVRPQLWKQQDARLAKLQVLAKEVKDIENLPDSADKQNKLLAKLAEMVALNEQNKYAAGVTELFADSWAFFNDPKIKQADIEKIGKNLQKAYIQNSALDQRYRGAKATLNMKTKEVNYKAISPTVADVGSVRWSNQNQTITWGNVENRYGGARSLKDDFKFNNVDGLEANASYYLHYNKRNKDYVATSLEKVQKDVNILSINQEDLPLLNAIYKNHLEDGKELSSPFVIQDYTKFGDTSKFTINNMMELRNWLKNRKLVLAKQLNGVVQLNQIEPYTFKDIARILDTSEDFVKYATRNIDPEDNPMLTRAFRGEKGEDIDSHIFGWQAWNIETPEHLMLNYKRSAVEDGNLLNSMAATMSRRKIWQEERDALVAEYLGEKRYKRILKYASNFSYDITAQSQGARAATAFHGDFGGTSAVQYMGATDQQWANVDRQTIRDQYTSLVLNINRSADAKADMAAIDTLLRQDDYVFAPKDIDEFLNGVEILVAGGEKKYNKLIQDTNAGDADAQAALEAIWETRRKINSSSVVQLLASDAGQAGNVIMRRNLMEDMITLAQKNANDHMQFSIDVDKLLDDTAVVEIKTTEVADMLKLYTKDNDELYHARTRLNRLKGKSVKDRRGIIHPPKFNMKDYPHFVLVKNKNPDGHIANSKQLAVVTAKNKESLEYKINLIRKSYGDDVEILTRQDNKDFFEQYDIYQRELDFVDVEMNQTLKKKGVFFDIAPTPREELAEDYVNSLISHKLDLNNKYLELAHAEEMAALRWKAAEWDRTAKSVTGRGTHEHNPYMEMYLTAMGKTNESGPIQKAWLDGQRGLDEILSIGYNAVARSIGKVAAALGLNPKVVEVPWEDLNKTLEHYGMRGVYTKHSREEILNNAKISREAMGRLISKTNAILATGMLRLDTAHSIVNIMSVPILTAPEISSLINKLKGPRGQQIRKLLSSPLTDENIRMPTASKVLQQAAKDLTKQVGMEDYRKMGLITTDLQDYMAALHDLGNIHRIKDMAGYQKFEEKIAKAAKILSKPVDWSEEQAKYFAARSADIIAEAAGITGQQRAMLLNTFVTRTNGNYIANQRPTMFQGWGGQAIGLFQTYSFNMAQQFFRHIEDGNKKSVFAMLALQAGIFGAQSIPGFNHLNTAIAMRDSERGEVDDIYSIVHRELPEVAEFLLYGAGSQITTPVLGEGIALYTRGNLNPHNPMILPTSIDEIPATSFIKQNIETLIGLYKNLSNESPAKEALLHGIAHNAFNRPLRGIGQLLQGERTSKKGSLLISYDELNTSLIAAKVLGVSPMSEEIALQAFYRAEKFKSKRREKLGDLGESVRLLVRDEIISTDDWIRIAEKYQALGGRQSNFSGWMKEQMLGTSVSQLEDARSTLTDPYGLYIQGIMGAEVDTIKGSPLYLIPEALNDEAADAATGATVAQ